MKKLNRLVVLNIKRKIYMKFNVDNKRKKVNEYTYKHIILRIQMNNKNINRMRLRKDTLS